MNNKQGTLSLTEDWWHAITHNDKSYDDVFIYAVLSTGICCRPSCKSRDPKRENILIYNDVDEAIAEGFRPCKRCKPGGIHLPDEEWVIQIKQYIDANYHEPLTLQKLADQCHGSPYHLQRTFKKVTGVTPIEYIQQVRILHAIKKLQSNDRVIAKVGADVGFYNTSYFITLFKNITGQTPKQYQRSYVGKEVQVND